MYCPEFIKCFFIGVLAASGCGPIFILTFNRSAVCGFRRGFYTALGASLGDALYFSLGLLGILSIMSQSKNLINGLELFGGIMLILMGIISFKRTSEFICSEVECSSPAIISILKAFLITCLNPFVIMFFMAISLKFFSNDLANQGIYGIFKKSSFVMLGSISVLSIVSFIASHLGSCITPRKMRYLLFVSGIAFFFFGLYFVFSFFSGYLFNI